MEEQTLVALCAVDSISASTNGNREGGNGLARKLECRPTAFDVVGTWEQRFYVIMQRLHCPSPFACIVYEHDSAAAPNAPSAGEDECKRPEG